jgi:hypothetical protein
MDQFHPNENSPLIINNWIDSSKLHEIVKYEYHMSKKDTKIQESLKILQKNGLMYLGEWKEIKREHKEKYPRCLVDLLDKLVGIKPENEYFHLSNLTHYFLDFFGSINWRVILGDLNIYIVIWNSKILWISTSIIVKLTFTTTLTTLCEIENKILMITQPDQHI